MKNKVRNSLFVLLGMIALFIIGCSSSGNISNEDYNRCYETSLGKSMVETEEGYFLYWNGLFCYADKKDLTTWVPVCNKPNCAHERGGYGGSCNANLPVAFYEENGKLYGYGQDMSNGEIHIYEIQTDGSGLKEIYTVPQSKERVIDASTNLTFGDRMVSYYRYLDEFGNTQHDVITLSKNKDGEWDTKTLYEENSTRTSAIFSQQALQFQLRGDDSVWSTLLEEEGDNYQNIITRIGEDSLEKVVLPEKADLFGGYLNGDTYIYYEVGEGFYQVDVASGEMELLFESQSEDGVGYVFSEEYMVETNRYSQYRAEESYFRFYNGEKWIDIELPQAISEANKVFYPYALASDRMFLLNEVSKEVTQSDGTTKLQSVIDWYYFKIEEEQPIFVYMGEIPSEDREEGGVVVEETEETTEEEGFEDIVVFDNEDFFLKIVNAYIKNGEYYIDVEYENRNQEDEYNIGLYDCSINGMHCKTFWAYSIEAGKNGVETIPIGRYAKQYNISQFYDADDYTKIELFFLGRNRSQREIYQEKVVTLYPKGEENVTLFTREPLDTDIVLVDNEYIRVLLIGYETCFVKNDVLKVYMLNKTDKNIRLYVEEASVNNQFILKHPYTDEERKEIEESENMMRAEWIMFDFLLNPNACSIYQMALFDWDIYDIRIDDRFFKTNQITSIEEMAIHLKMYSCEVSDYDDGEYSFDETIVVRP